MIIFISELLRQARPWSLLAVVGCMATALRGEVTLPALFGSNMVLQADRPVPVWGRAAPGETIAVQFRDQTVTATADAQGRWRATLAPTAPGGPFALTVIGRNTIALDNVLVGEVWLCGGQSNMTFRVDQADRAAEEIAAAHHPRIRLFTVEEAVDESGPREDCKGRWVECSPETVAGFTAAGYFMGRRLHETLGRPVGLIHSSWGGTKAEAWTPRSALAADPALAPILTAWKKELENFPRARAEFEAKRERLVADWQRAAAQAAAAGRAAPMAPRLRTGPNTQWAPCGLYNAMIAPLAPFALRGVAWYQGEANVSQSARYRRLLPALITAWRGAWGWDFPFVFVQLPNLAREHSHWPELREAQAAALALPHTAMAVTIDVGDPQNLHPTHKQAVGLRLALAAESLAYGLPAAERLSPVFSSASFAPDGTVRVEFAPGRGALAIRGGATLHGFAVAATDRKFVAAEARLAGDAVIVRSANVPQPAAVRYAWSENPIEANLTNAAGLPLAPFRTDDWPESAAGAGDPGAPPD